MDPLYCTQILPNNVIALCSLFVAGGELFLRHDQNAFQGNPTDIHPEAINRPRLQDRHQKPQARGPNFQCRRSGKLLIGWFRNGKHFTNTCFAMLYLVT